MAFTFSSDGGRFIARVNVKQNIDELVFMLLSKQYGHIHTLEIYAENQVQICDIDLSALGNIKTLTFFGDIVCKDCFPPNLESFNCVSENISVDIELPHLAQVELMYGADVFSIMTTFSFSSDGGKLIAKIYNQKDIEAMVSLLKKYKQIHTLEIFNKKETPSRLRDIDLSMLVNIKTLFLCWIACKSDCFPPNLESLKCWTKYMSTDIETPKLSHADLIYGGDAFYDDLPKQRFILCEILEGELLPQIEHLKISAHCLRKEFVSALEKRPSVLKTFEAPWIFDDPKDDLRVLVQKVENLIIYMPEEEEIMTVDVLTPRVKTLTLTLKPEYREHIDFEFFTGNWIKTYIEEITVDCRSFCARFLEFESLHSLFPMERLRKITFLVSACSTSFLQHFISKMQDGKTFLPWPIHFAFYSTSKDLKEGLQKEVSFVREITTNFYFDFEWNTVSKLITVRPNLGWLPHKHIDFCQKGRVALETLARGITVLWYNNTKEKRKEEKNLVRVDPACLEFIFEGLKETDFY